ncbi:MAG: GDSL-type esterase/lipase family protein [Deltaproteobacteria bacterium]|jgi:hypothetical protein
MGSTYLALGDSMSIDDYTGVDGGGAVAQLFGRLGDPWSLDDRTEDGQVMEGVPRGVTGELITLTIGGNNLLLEQSKILERGLASFARRHLAVLKRIRDDNPDAIFVVGNVYAPDAPLGKHLRVKLREANAVIAENVAEVGARLADIEGAFEGRESELLTQVIEPNLAGAKVIADLFAEASGLI